MPRGNKTYPEESLRERARLGEGKNEEEPRRRILDKNHYSEPVPQETFFVVNHKSRCRERLSGTDTLPQSCTEMGGIVIKSPDVADVNLVDSCCVG